MNMLQKVAYGIYMSNKKIIYRCPYCKTRIKIKSYRDYYGSIFDVCLHCKNPYISTYKKELAICGLPKWAYWRLTPPSRVLLGILLGTLLIISMAAMFQGYSSDDIDPIGVAIIAITFGIYPIWDFCHYNSRVDFFENEMELSKERLSDPDYAKLFVEPKDK